MAEKGSPCASRLGVATETTGVVRLWAAWAPAASRWAFCRERTPTLRHPLTCTGRSLWQPRRYRIPLKSRLLWRQEVGIRER
ncbi:hypothetical protein EYF80_025971 [Liparis tanakae]|uniref:Uncharacterized protein n=1 Tax=Liparis tanakae TaxID=230148 RepID=A0A4Z2HD58_9TELE|nr:hypothetical protein EYF80_025971 [Liparis tanakae]